MPTASRSGVRTVGAERGTATVEFALLLPLLLVMCLALVQVGLLARDRLLAEAVARAGARGRYPPECFSSEVPIGGPTRASREGS